MSDVIWSSCHRRTLPGLVKKKVKTIEGGGVGVGRKKTQQASGLVEGLSGSWKMVLPLWEAGVPLGPFCSSGRGIPANQHKNDLLPESCCSQGRWSFFLLVQGCNENWNWQTSFVSWMRSVFFWRERRGYRARPPASRWLGLRPRALQWWWSGWEPMCQSRSCSCIFICALMQWWDLLTWYVLQMEKLNTVRSYLHFFLDTALQCMAAFSLGQAWRTANSV